VNTCRFVLLWHGPNRERILSIVALVGY
jgi:hypothetical protein